MQYWSNVLDILRKKVGAEVIVTAVPGFAPDLACMLEFTLIMNITGIRTGSITSRSENLDRLLQEKARGRGINLMAHSMGGLDCKIDCYFNASRCLLVVNRPSSDLAHTTN